MQKTGRSVGVKLGVGFLAVALVAVGLAIYSYFALQRVEAGADDLYAAHLLPLVDLHSAENSVYQVRNALGDYRSAPTQRAALRTEIEALLARANQYLADHTGTEMAADEAVAFQTLTDAWNEYAALVAVVLDGIDAGASGATAEQATAALNAAEKKVMAAYVTMIERSLAVTKVTHEQAVAVFDSAVWWLAAGILAGLLLAMGLAIWIARGITHNLSKLTHAAEAMADGDLSQRVVVKTGDEVEVLALAFNRMAANLEERAETDRQAKQTLEAGTQNLSAAAAEILAAVSQHTASANEQSAAVNQVTATVSEAQASSQQATVKAGEVVDLAQTALQVGQEGATAVENILAGMQDIRTKVEGIARNILALSEQTQQIGDIISSVNDIADQSNILAINAAIEAAKAGEQGKGFAVVAGEVRNLAEQSKQATMKVRTILGDIQKATNSAVLVTEQGTRGVEVGMSLTQRAGEVINQLAGTIRTATQSAQQIAGASRQQSVAMDQIAQAMREINQATMQFVAGARQSQTAAEGLNDLARQLLQLASRYSG
jgi:methyl-accepting chemotaxis protein